MYTLSTFTAVLCTALFITVSDANCAPGNFITNNGNCTACPPGSSQPASNQNLCIPCHDNEIAAAAGTATCTSCGALGQSNREKTACTCMTGAVVDPSDGSCRACEPGTIDEGFSLCSICGRNSFQPLAGQQTCRPCPPNTFSEFRATECIRCPDGEALINGECGTCPAGEGYNTDRQECETCRVGMFSARRGIKGCIPCPRGSFSMRGAQSCTQCSNGRVAIARRSGLRCGLCAAGRFYSEETFRCMRCQEGRFQPMASARTRCFVCGSDTFSGRGAAECTRCTREDFRNGPCSFRCERGFSMNDGRCVRCGFNQYSTGSSASCSICPTGAFVRADLTGCEECASGTVFLRSTNACGTCPPGRRYDRLTGRCPRCVGNSANAVGDAEFCVPCADGMRPNARRTECVQV